MVDAAGEHYSGGASQVSSVSLCSWRTLAWNQQLKQQQQYHQAHPWHHHFFGRTQPSVHCLIGHGGAAERKDSGASCKTKSPPKPNSIVQTQPGQDKYPNSDKANDLKNSTEREEKHPEGCETDPKSMEENEEKPPEGCNNDPKPMMI